jgi:K+-sensing histidine kinase KdpD
LRNLFSIEQELQNKFLSTEAMQEIDELLRAAITLVRTSRKSCPTFEALFDHNSDFGLFTLITFRIPKLTSQEEAERIEAKDLIKKYLRSLIATISATKFWAEGEKLESKPVNLHDLIEEITPSLNIEFIVTEESIVQIDVPKDLVISADPYTLQALLENMVKNAAVHGDALRLKIVGSRQSDKIATIEVSDDGPGVNANIAPRIFDWKVTDGKGSGLGLANGIERMAQMGGTMTLEPNGGLENELGSKGAKFIMTFAIA